MGPMAALGRHSRVSDRHPVGTHRHPIGISWDLGGRDDYRTVGVSITVEIVVSKSSKVPVGRCFPGPPVRRDQPTGP